MREDRTKGGEVCSTGCSGCPPPNCHWPVLRPHWVRRAGSVKGAVSPHVSNSLLCWVPVGWASSFHAFRLQTYRGTGVSRRYAVPRRRLEPGSPSLTWDTNASHRLTGWCTRAAFMGLFFLDPSPSQDHSSRHLCPPLLFVAVAAAIRLRLVQLFCQKLVFLFLSCSSSLHSPLSYSV